MAVSGPGKVVLIGTNVLAGNDPAHRVFRAVYQGPGVFTNLVEFLNWNNIFVGRNLHYGVTRRVEDQLAGLHLPFTIIVDNFGPGVWLVNNYLTARELL